VTSVSELCQIASFVVSGTEFLASVTGVDLLRRCLKLKKNYGS
jgi:hypothetical protein